MTSSVLNNLAQAADHHSTLQSQKLDEINKKQMLSAGSLSTPLLYHTPISSQEVW